MVGKGGVEGLAFCIHVGQFVGLGQGTAIGGQFVQIPLQPVDGAVLVEQGIISLLGSRDPVIL